MMGIYILKKISIANAKYFDLSDDELKESTQGVMVESITIGVIEP